MTTRFWWISLPLLAATPVLPATPVFAQEAKERVNVYQYAVDHPVADASVRMAPSLGASVPQSVEIARAQGNEVYGYFYYEGRPVIVELATRAVVRIDQ